MGTPCVIAKVAGDGWQGRYNHSDGYPTSMVPRLMELVARDGVEKVTKALVEDNVGWAVVRADHTGIDNYLDDRGVIVEGYGLAYTAKNFPHGGEVVTDRDSADEMYLYVLNRHGVRVHFANGERYAFCGAPRWDEPVDHDELVAMECGRDFERCSHYAWVHFPDAPREGRCVGTAVWLGRETPGFGSAAYAVVRGERVALQGSGGQAYANGQHWWRYGGQRDPRRPVYWFGSVTGADGQCRDERLARVTREGYKLEVPLVVEIRDGEITLPAGTVVRG